MQPGDLVDSTETITLGGKDSTTDNTDDPGTENDTPTGDGEHDDFTDHTHADAKVGLEDVLVSKEKKNLPDGSYSESQVKADITDGIIVQADDGLDDQHGANSGTGVTLDGPGLTGEVDTDHETSDDKLSVGDKIGDTVMANSVTIKPVTNGTLTTTNQSTTYDLGYASDASDNNLTQDDQGSSSGPTSSIGETDKATDDFSQAAFDTTIGGGATMLVLKDPVTGVTTNILSARQGSAMLGDQVGDDVSDTTKSGTAGASDSFNENDRVDASAGDSSQGPLDISIVGSPTPGITSDFEQMLILGSADGSQIQGEDTAPSRTTDSGDVKFSTSAMGTEGGKIIDTVTDTINTDDGHGNTVHSTDTLVDNGMPADMALNIDRGEEDFSDGNPQTAFDSETDTDVATNELGGQSNDIEDLQATLTSVDPAAGVVTTDVVTDHATDRETDLQVDTSKDIHSSSATAAGPGTDGVTFDDEATTTGTTNGSPTVVITARGGDAQGDQVNDQETLTLTMTGTDSSTDDDSGETFSSGTTTGTGGDTEKLQSNEQQTVGITDTFGGTITLVDPLTGIKTTTVDTVVITGSGNEHDARNETDVRTAGSPESDTSTDSEGGSDTAAWNASETVTQTNPDGSANGPATTSTHIGNDTRTGSAGSNRAADGTVVTSRTETESGSETPPGGPPTYWNTDGSGIPGSGSGGSSGGGSGGTGSTSAFAAYKPNAPRDVVQAELQSVEAQLKTLPAGPLRDFKLKDKQLLLDKLSGVINSRGEYDLNRAMQIDVAKWPAESAQLQANRQLVAEYAPVVGASLILLPDAVELAVPIAVDVGASAYMYAVATAAEIQANPLLEAALINGLLGYLDTRGDSGDKLEAAAASVFIGHAMAGGSPLRLNRGTLLRAPGGTGAAYNPISGQGLYVLRDSRGQIRYVGRGDAPARLLVHAGPGSGKEALTGEVLFNNNLSEAQAVSLEQELQQLLGGTLSTNLRTDLANKIQALGERNPRFLRLEFAADDDLLIEALRRAGLLGR